MAENKITASDIIAEFKKIHKLQVAGLNSQTNISKDLMEEIDKLSKKIDALAHTIDVVRINMNHTLTMVNGVQENIVNLDKDKKLYTGEYIAGLREKGYTWNQIGIKSGIKVPTLYKRYEKYKKESLLEELDEMDGDSLEE